MPVSVDGMHWLQVDRIPAMLRIHLGIQRDEDLRGWSALATLPFVPAGVYDVRPDIREPRGEVMVAVSNTDLAVAHTALFGAVHQMLVRLPVDVRSLVVRGDEEAASRPARRDRATDADLVSSVSRRCRRRPARRGVPGVNGVLPRRRGNPRSNVVLDRMRSFLARSLFNRRESRRPSTLRIRNGPIESDLTLQSPAFSRLVALGPSDEQTIDVPVDPRAAAVVVQLTSSGNCGQPAPAQGGDRRPGVHVTVE